MFIQYSVRIDRPIEDLAAALSRGPRRWFPQLGDNHDYAVGPRFAGLPLRRRVTVEAGEPVKTATWMEVPISWKASFAQKLFPVMQGKVELAPVDHRTTRVTVSGMYEPPLGRIGKELDDALMHRVAESTVKELAESVAEHLVAGVR